MNAAIAYQVGGNTVLTVPGSDTRNISLGLNAGSAVSGGVNMVFVGQDAGLNATTANGSTFVGVNSGVTTTTGGANTFIGFAAGGANTTGSNNMYIGWSSAVSGTTGSNNLVLGYHAGSNLTTGSSDIYIGNGGVATENNTIRIGVQGTGSREQNVTYIAGITGATSSGGVNVSGQQQRTARYQDFVTAL